MMCENPQALGNLCYDVDEWLGWFMHRVNKNASSLASYSLSIQWRVTQFLIECDKL